MPVILNIIVKLPTLCPQMADSKDPIQSVQTFGRKKTATAVAYCKRGKGLIRVNGKPLTEVCLIFVFSVSIQT